MGAWKNVLDGWVLFKEFFGRPVILSSTNLKITIVSIDDKNQMTQTRFGSFYIIFLLNMYLALTEQSRIEGNKNLVRFDYLLQQEIDHILNNKESFPVVYLVNQTTCISDNIFRDYLSFEELKNIFHIWWLVDFVSKLLYFLSFIHHL